MSLAHNEIPYFLVHSAFGEMLEDRAEPWLLEGKLIGFLGWAEKIDGVFLVRTLGLDINEAVYRAAPGFARVC